MQVDELAALLPDCLVTAETSALHYANLTTFATSTASKAIVYPRAVGAIRRLLRHCAEQRHTLFVVSCGKNWGFGSRVPVQDVDILLDLSKLNAISDYDPRYGTVRVEPGVTFGQLSAYLRQAGNQHFLNVIGGDPNSSVLGNILERGDGAGPYCERSEYCCGASVLLANGEELQTGFANVRHSRLGALAKFGLGPNFQELFLQSNYGIVTGLTIWLCPMPAQFRSFHLEVAATVPLAQLLESFRDLYRRGVLHAPVTFWNDYKQLIGGRRIPATIKRGQPLGRRQLQEISNRYCPWYAFGGIYVADEPLARATARAVARALRTPPLAGIRFRQVTARRLKLLRLAERLGIAAKVPGNNLLAAWDNNPLLGHIDADNLQGLFWRKKEVLPDRRDPALQQCGLHWNAFLLPFEGALMEAAFAQLDELCFAFGFEPVLSFILVNDRYVRVFHQLIFDRENADEEHQAARCQRAVFDYLEQAGFSHYRLDILQMNTRPGLLKNDSLNKKLKAALDPQGIISPGRYFTG